MGNVLVVGEVKDNVLRKISREITSAGKKIADTIGGQVEVLLIGEGVDKFAGELAAVGADKIIIAKSSEFSGEGWAHIINTIIAEKKPSVVLMPHSGYGRDYSPIVSIKNKSSIVTDVVGLKVEGGKIIGKKPIYSGKAFANLKVNSDIQMFTVRPNSIEIVEKKGAGVVENSSVTAGESKVKTHKIELATGAKVPLTEASIVVSGGRGMKGPEHFTMLQELCDILGAAMGASRAAVDAGWVAHTLQVGQTGTTVSPNCYIAVGISGSIQHMAGMSSSKYIVAINKDPEAPVFKVATYGVVADLFDVVPHLRDEFKKALS